MLAQQQFLEQQPMHQQQFVPHQHFMHQQPFSMQQADMDGNVPAPMVGTFHRVKSHHHHAFYPTEYHYEPQPIFKHPSLAQKLRTLFEGDTLENNEKSQSYSAPLPSYQAPPPSYQAPSPPYQAPVPQPPQYPSYHQQYSAPVYPQSSCGSNLLIGCQPQVQHVPCSYSPYGQYSQSYVPPYYPPPGKKKFIRNLCRDSENRFLEQKLKV